MPEFPINISRGHLLADQTSILHKLDYLPIRVTNATNYDSDKWYYVWCWYDGVYYLHVYILWHFFSIRNTSNISASSIRFLYCHLRGFFGGDELQKKQNETNLGNRLISQPYSWLRVYGLRHEIFADCWVIEKDRLGRQNLVMGAWENVIQTLLLLL